MQCRKYLFRKSRFNFVQQVPVILDRFVSLQKGSLHEFTQKEQVLKLRTSKSSEFRYETKLLAYCRLVR